MEPKPAPAPEPQPQPAETPVQPAGSPGQLIGPTQPPPADTRDLGIPAGPIESENQPLGLPTPSTTSTPSGLSE